MQRPGQGIVRANTDAPRHTEYPKHMVHPGFQPGTPDREVDVESPDGKKWRKAYVGGQSIRFPPVLVKDAHQEEYHAAEGYIAIGKSDPAAFANAVRAAAPSAEVHVPDAYPKWITSLGRSVDSAEEEAIALGLPMPEAASSEAPGTPAINTEVNHLLVPLPSADATRIAALEQKVDTIVNSFDRLSGMLAQVIAGQAPTATAEPPAPDTQGVGTVADPAPSPVPVKLPSHADKVRAGIAKRKAAAAQKQDNL